VNFSKSQLTEAQIAEIKKELNPQILNNIKSSSDMKKLRDWEVTFKYVYKSNDNYELMSMTFTPSDYK
jgi:hypothetical protein